MIQTIKNSFTNFVMGLSEKEVIFLSIIFAIIFTYILCKVFKIIFRKCKCCSCTKNSKSTNVYNGLKKTRDSFLSSLNGLFSRSDKEQEKLFDELEEILVSCDVGERSSSFLCYQIKDEIKKLNLNTKADEFKEKVVSLLKEKIIDILKDERKLTIEGETKIILVVGVNGVGKTTTIAKLARKYKEAGKKVLLVAADTFRAAAVEQLDFWAKKVGVDIVKGEQDAKPSTVVFDAMKKLKEETFDVVLIDTAGRLHNKSNLMQELTGIQNAIIKNRGKKEDEAILVIDGTSGQNAILQAKEFNGALDGGLTGIIITKLDGTAKGGILIAVKRELDVPVYFIGVGEKAADLVEFNENEFVDGLL